MKKISKFLLGSIIFIFLLLILVYLTAGFWVKNAISTLIPQMTKTSVSLEKADISLLRGKIHFQGLKVGNPQGFSNANAFELGEVSVHFQPSSLFSEKIIVDELKISGTKVNSEINKGLEMNLVVITNNIQRYLGKPVVMENFPKEPQLPEEEKNVSSGKSLVVRDLSITGSEVSFTILSQKMNVALPNVQQKDVGENEKITLSELVAGFFEELTTFSMQAITQANKENLNKLFNYVGEKTKSDTSVRGLLKQLPNLF